MTSNIINLCTIALIVTFARLGNAIMCYSCFSTIDDRCRDTFNNTEAFFYDCTESVPQFYREKSEKGHRATSCFKKVMELGDGMRVVQRSCYYNDISNIGMKCKDEPNAIYKTVYCDICDNDGCNSSKVKRPISAVIALFLALTFIL